MARHRGRQRQRPRHLLERTKCDTAQAVFLVDDLALFCNAQSTVDRAGRRTENGDVCLAAATADGAATAVKKGEFDLVSLNRLRQCVLGVLQCPPG